MTDTLNSEKSIVDFYDTLAPDYDAMTGFEKRFSTEQPFFSTIVERYKIGTALDAGCGTGFHSLLLAQLGVSVTAVDVSPAMLENVTRHARQLNLSVKIVESDFQTLAQKLGEQYDAVFCLGNSLPHLVDDRDLRSSLASFASLMNPDGILVIQLLNYERILSQHANVQNIKEVGDTTFIRSYEYEGETLRFNIVKLEKREDIIVQSLNAVRLRPLRKAGLSVLLEESGFGEVSFFGGISLEPFIPESSKDLVIIAKRRQDRFSIS